MVSRFQHCPFLLPSSPRPFSSFLGPSCSHRQRDLLLHSVKLLLDDVLLLLFVLMDLLVLEVVGTLLLHGINLVLVSFGKTFCDLQTLLHTFLDFLLIFNFLPLQGAGILIPTAAITLLTRQRQESSCKVVYSMVFLCID